MNNIIVNKIITKPAALEIKGATLLSAKEASKLLTEEERNYKGWWWLRSSGDSTIHAAYVHSSGKINCNGYFVKLPDGFVRPALIISLDKSFLEIGDKFFFKGKEFKVISESLAWMCKEDIGCAVFRDNYKQLDSSFYEASDVKKVVNEWYNSLI